MICKSLTRSQANGLYIDVMHDEDTKALRELCMGDLFFLLTTACKRRDMDRDWLYERCREVEADPDGYLDLWAREHYKSTIITFGKTIQDVLNDPEITANIFSHTRPIAKAFLNQIKMELEKNVFLQDLFPDILYKKPESESPKWSLDNGIQVKRKTNPKEATIEASGLVDGQPTSRHFGLLIYDDIVTKESVTTPEQIQKTTAALELSYDLGSEGGRRRFIGTRYHANDTYKTIMDRKTAIPRIKPATKNGEWPGESVFRSQEFLEAKRRDQGPYTFSCQQLLNPVADKAMSFKEEWLKFYAELGETKSWNKYLLVDPAGEKKGSSDYTVMLVVGLAPDNNYYLIDGIRDRLNLTQRASKLIELHRKHNPRDVGYEKYGKDSDIEHIQDKMERDNYRFNITPLGGQVKKNDRIKMLIPKFEQFRVWLPKSLSFVDYEGRSIDFVQKFIDDEFKSFPVCVHDDMLDCLARILDQDLGAAFPKLQEEPKEEPRFYDPGTQGLSWLG